MRFGWAHGNGRNCRHERPQTQVVWDFQQFSSMFQISSQSFSCVWKGESTNCRLRQGFFAIADGTTRTTIHGLGTRMLICLLFWPFVYYIMPVDAICDLKVMFASATLYASKFYVIFIVSVFLVTWTFLEFHLTCACDIVVFAFFLSNV